LKLSGKITEKSGGKYGEENNDRIFRIFNNILDVIIFITKPVFPEENFDFEKRKELIRKEMRKIKILSVLQGLIFGFPSGIAGILAIPFDVLLIMVAGISIAVKTAWAFGFNPNKPEEKKFIFELVKKILSEEGKNILLLKGKTGTQKLKNPLKKENRLKFLPIFSAFENSIINFKTINRIGDKIIEEYSERYMKTTETQNK